MSEMTDRTMSEMTALEQRYTDLLVEITNALGEDFQLMRELDDVVALRLAAAEDHSPRVNAFEQRIERMEQEFERLRTALALMGHLASTL